MIVAAIIISALVGIALATCLYGLKKQIDSSEIRGFYAQVISGVLLIMASFWSAYGLFVLQHNEEVRVAQRDSLIQIHNELSENTVTLTEENYTLRSYLRLRMETAAWERGKYQIPTKTPNLDDGLRALYDELDRYNQQVDFMRFLATERSATSTMVPDSVWENDARSRQRLIERLSIFEKLTSRELVLAGVLDRDQYVTEYGSWQDSGLFRNHCG